MDTSPPQEDLISFLRYELAVPVDSINLGLRQSRHAPNLLPIVLWQYGLVSTQQLDQIFKWQEQQSQVRDSAPSWLRLG
ncbi:hypothetical protein XM38_012570 [Halomicronema hongdechloris C2206]|uniref:DUF2949 domain-containing protein n=1 Tax=Halomicronema hongdechloris C2206 TaxID=1641165 RepID=A0A1V8NHH3_9CYAN|nr:DUF2949 domain-containing protein [Halomicronema hongdechloris]ASC70319.1 hypothetical protein XM38_012570 [Halomicronema hongdechloris C2206]